MYPSLKTPVIGLELITLNLTALYSPWRTCARAERVSWTLARRLQDPERWGLFESGQIEEAGDAVCLEQLQLLRVPGQAYGDDGGIGEEHVILPFLKWNCREHIVIADDDVGQNVLGGLGGRNESDCVRRLQAHLGEIARDVLTQERMARDAESAKRDFCFLQMRGSHLGTHARS